MVQSDLEDPPACARNRVALRRILIFIVLGFTGTSALWKRRSHNCIGRGRTVRLLRMD